MSVAWLRAHIPSTWTTWRNAKMWHAQVRPDPNPHRQVARSEFGNTLDDMTDVDLVETIQAFRGTHAAELDDLRAQYALRHEPERGNHICGLCGFHDEQHDPLTQRCPFPDGTF